MFSEEKMLISLEKKKSQAIFPEERDYLELCKEVYEKIGAKEYCRLLDWEECELEFDYLGFLEQYQELRELPEVFTILDLGSGQALQGAFFKEHARYITVDLIPERARLRQENATHIQCELRRFFEETLPTLNLDREKTVAIGSYVPCKGLKELIEENFTYYKWVYPGEGKMVNLPEKELERE